MLRIGRLAENDRKCFEIDKIAKHGLHLYRKTANDLLLFFARYIYALHDFVFNIASIMFLFCFCSVHLFLNLVMFLVTLFISQNLTDPVKLGLFNKQLWQ